MHTCTCTSTLQYEIGLKRLAQETKSKTCRGMGATKWTCGSRASVPYEALPCRIMQPDMSYVGPFAGHPHLQQLCHAFLTHSSGSAVLYLGCLGVCPLQVKGHAFCWYLVRALTYASSGMVTLNPPCKLPGRSLMCHPARSYQ